MSDQHRVRIELTPQQKQQIKKLSGRDCETIELTVDELEERVAPSLLTSCASGGHIPNPSL